MSDLRHQFNASLAVADALPHVMRAVDALSQTKDHPEIRDRAKHVLCELREIAKQIEAAWEEYP